MFDPNRIFEQFTGHRGGGGLAGSLDALGGGSSRQQGGGGLGGMFGGGSSGSGAWAT
jgi:hypothetical protein